MYFNLIGAACFWDNKILSRFSWIVEIDRLQPFSRTQSAHQQNRVNDTDIHISLEYFLLTLVRAGKALSVSCG